MLANSSLTKSNLFYLVMNILDFMLSVSWCIINFAVFTIEFML